MVYLTASIPFQYFDIEIICDCWHERRLDFRVRLYLVYSSYRILTIPKKERKRKVCVKHAENKNACYRYHMLSSVCINTLLYQSFIFVQLARGTNFFFFLSPLYLYSLHLNTCTCENVNHHLLHPTKLSRCTCIIGFSLSIFYFLDG